MLKSYDSIIAMSHDTQNSIPENFDATNLLDTSHSVLMHLLTGHSHTEAAVHSLENLHADKECYLPYILIAVCIPV